MRALAIATPYAIPVVLLLAAFSARAEDPVTAAGKQRAAASRIEWDIREASHPILGSIRFAYMKSPVVTAVGISRLYSNVYVSCATNGRTIALEVTNQAAPDDPGGLQPATPPHLICKSPAPKGGTVQDAIAASWHVNELGDALASGYSPHKLRGCATIAIVEDVALPKGWAQASAPVQLEVTPYSKALDSIFVSCGEASAYAAQQPWVTARTPASGRTNVRAAPDIHSAIVAQLPPASVILVQSTGSDWWRAKPRAGPSFEGYIREDRLVVE